jgi:hypothetical protein
LEDGIDRKGQEKFCQDMAQMSGNPGGSPGPEELQNSTISTSTFVVEVRIAFMS